MMITLGEDRRHLRDRAANVSVLSVLWPESMTVPVKPERSCSSGKWAEGEHAGSHYLSTIVII